MSETSVSKLSEADKGAIRLGEIALEMVRKDGFLFPSLKVWPHVRWEGAICHLSFHKGIIAESEQELLQVTISPLNSFGQFEHYKLKARKIANQLEEELHRRGLI